MSNKNNIGDNNTFMGNVQPGNYGSGNTIIGATDNLGNTIINQPMAVGYNAKAGPGSIAIGYNAMAGSEILFLLSKLENMALKEGYVISEIKELSTILNTTAPSSNKIQTLWNIITGFKWTAEAMVLIHEINTMLKSVS